MHQNILGKSAVVNISVILIKHVTFCSRNCLPRITFVFVTHIIFQNACCSHCTRESVTKVEEDDNKSRNVKCNEQHEYYGRDKDIHNKYNSIYCEGLKCSMTIFS